MNAIVSQETSVLRVLPRPNLLMAMYRSTQVSHFVIMEAEFGIPLSDKAVESSGNVNSMKYIGIAQNIDIAPSIIKTHCHDFKPPWPFNYQILTLSSFLL
jgi:hypothetical protein